MASSTGELFWAQMRGFEPFPCISVDVRCAPPAAAANFDASSKPDKLCVLWFPHGKHNSYSTLGLSELTPFDSAQGRAMREAGLSKLRALKAKRKLEDLERACEHADAEFAKPLMERDMVWPDSEEEAEEEAEVEEEEEERKGCLAADSREITSRAAVL